MLTSSADPLFGVQLGVDRRILGPWLAGAGISGFFGEASRSSGTITIAHVALDLTAGLGNKWVDVKLGVRLGWASLSGSPSGPSAVGGTASGFVWGPMLAGSVLIVGPLRAVLQLGWLLAGVRGVVANASDVAVSEWWLSTGLGLQW
jgi:hypothetical protein